MIPLFLVPLMGGTDFLSMTFATVTLRLDFGIDEGLLAKDILCFFHLCFAIHPESWNPMSFLLSIIKGFFHSLFAKKLPHPSMLSKLLTLLAFALEFGLDASPMTPYELPDGQTIEFGADNFKIPDVLFNPSIAQCLPKKGEIPRKNGANWVGD